MEQPDLATLSEALRATVVWHEFRPWTYHKRSPVRPPGEDPCGYCGRTEAEHPWPMLIADGWKMGWYFVLTCREVPVPPTSEQLALRRRIQDVVHDYFTGELYLADEEEHRSRADLVADLLKAVAGE